MTRKEAIKILMNTAWLGTEQDDVETAIYMAVEALEQDNVIDRVLEIIDENLIEVTDGLNIEKDLIHNNALKKIKKAISALKGEQDETNR